MKLCVLCAHFEVTDGDRGYSEMTPGRDMSIGCAKYLWTVDNMETGGPEKFRTEIRRAKTCPHYVAAPSIPTANKESDDAI